MASGPSPALQIEPPGPGFWELDPVHFPLPVSRYWSEVHPGGFQRGTADFARAYGMLIEAIAMAYPRGFAYKQVTPVADADVPARLARAEEVFATRFWRDQLTEWTGSVKPAAIAAHRAIQAVDPDGLGDDDLAAHLRRCRDHHAAMLAQHMRYTAAAIVPTGDFLAHAQEWTGLPAAELLALMRGSSPVSAGASAELAALTEALRADPEAPELLHAEVDAAERLAALRQRPEPVGPALGAYLDLVGYRLLDGFDIVNPCAIELPDVLLRSLRVALEGTAVVDDLQERIGRVRDRVPDANRAAFDELLEEARLTYPIRDERGVFSDIWASGLMRRAVQAAGRRLAQRGRIQVAAHLLDAGLDEMTGLLLGRGGPGADELAERAAYRTAHTAREVPATLGTPPPPPDLSVLPAGAARLMRATGLALAALFGSSEAPHEEHRLRGLAASPGIYEGPARLITRSTEFDRIQRGDVLVTASTTEAFNILLPLLGAIVTDSGGLLSHSAIVAREFGIPGVVGTRQATAVIADGQRLRVDGTAGTVTVIG
ncbi:PEP-utilizing enzyme [Cyanobium sp. FGCU-6]|nr:PEP-utilizing enzyme [Cyanobium sp. FGCU6]